MARITIKALRFLVPVFVILSCFPALRAPKAFADDFKFNVSAALQQEYNDNLFLNTGEKKSDFVTTLSPLLSLSEKTERLDLGLSAQLDAVQYRKEHDLNSINHNYSGTGQYRLSEKFALSGNAGYIRDSRSNQEVLSTGFVLNAVRREHQVYGAAASMVFTERTSGTLSYEYDRDTFDNPNFVNSDAHIVNFGIVHDFGKYIPNLQGRTNLGYSVYRTDTSKVQNYTGTVGAGWSFSEKWSLQLDVGPVYTQSEFDTVVGYFDYYYNGQYAFSVPDISKVNNSGWGLIAQGSISYKDEYAAGSLTFRRDILPASGQTGASERTAFTLDLKYQFTSRWTGAFTSGYILNQADAGQFSALQIDQWTVYANPRIRYSLAEWARAYGSADDIALEASYLHTQVAYRTTQTSADQNIFMLRLLMQHTLLE